MAVEKMSTWLNLYELEFFNSPTVFGRHFTIEIDYCDALLTILFTKHCQIIT